MTPQPRPGAQARLAARRRAGLVIAIAVGVVMAGQVFDDEPVVVGLPAEIDVANADEVLDLLCSAAGAGVRVVVGDLSSTRFCDCYGFRALVAARKQLAAAGVDLWLAVPPGNVRRVMRLLGVDHGLDAYPPVAAVKGDDGRG